MAWNIPEDLKYTENDEWVRVNGADATYGVSDYAQDQLSDVVYIELPDVGATLTKGEILGTIESVKAASDLYAAVSGEVTEVNSVVVDEPEIVNSDPYGDAWMFKLS